MAARDVAPGRKWPLIHFQTSNKQQSRSAAVSPAAVQRGFAGLEGAGMRGGLSFANQMTGNRRTFRLSLAVLAATLAAASFATSAAAQTTRAQAAQDQYQQAQQLEAALEVRPGGTRTESDYQRVIDAYRRVGQLSVTPLFVTPSLMAIGRLYDEMGRLFDTSYFEKAEETYQYLLRLYPHSRLAPEALYSVAELESGPLSNPALARKSLESLVTLYPSSDQADRARLELAGNPQSTETPSQPLASPAPTNASEEEAPTERPPRGGSGVEGGEEGKRPALVRSVATKRQSGMTRIVVYLSGPVKFESAQIAHPERVYFDLARAYLVHAHGMRLSLDTPYVNSVDVAQNEPHVVRVVLDIHPGAGYWASLLRNPYRLAIDVGRRREEINPSENAQPASAEAGNDAGSIQSSEQTDAVNSPSAAGAGGSEAESEAELVTKGKLTPAQPTHAGATSLTRALGLKIDRIVIDPGHGGFDTGSIGPTGLEEKTVTLEISRRLGRLIRQRLPGTQVVYTRDSDHFVPLEERTEIANDKQADLFISIHANSSTDPEARGVEVYYLNFTTSPEALAVAARENALAQEPVHQLQDLLKKISLNDKIEESQELALDMDHSLVHQLQLGHVHAEDRGVKKAPFVVLIGAHMPSVLVEVSFLSNPTDEELLKEARYRQRIALGLFDGIKGYLSSLNSLSFNDSQPSTPAHR